MKRKKFALACGALAVGSSVLASPEISGVTMEVVQPSSGMVEIGYRLEGDDPAIVTFDVLKNGVSIGGEYLTNAVGDLNRRIEPGERKIYWRADQTWRRHDETSGLSVEVKAWSLDAPPTFMCVDLKEVPGAVFYYEDKSQIPGGIGDLQYKTDKLLMRKITAEGVTFLMGCPTSVAAPKRGDNEAPHLVTFGSDYYMGVYEVTRGQYPLLTGNPCAECAPGGGDNDLLPAGGITYLTLLGYSKYPSESDPASSATGYAIGLARSRIGIKFNIPTEAQWEYACRAGTSSVRYDGKEVSGWSTGVNQDLDVIANYKVKDANRTPIAVGSLQANAWDLYDMLGNVAEWCLDYYGKDYKHTVGESLLDPTGPDTPDKAGHRVVRGGSCYDQYAYQMRSAYRTSNKYSEGAWPSRGFRLVVSVK